MAEEGPFSTTATKRSTTESHEFLSHTDHSVETRNSMVAPNTAKRKREQLHAPAASTSSNVIKGTTTELSWPSILSGIRGQRGEPGAIEALNQLSRSINIQASASSAKKSSNEPSYRVWTDFLAYWQADPGLKEVVTVWEKGDQIGNNTLVISSLHLYASLLNTACSPNAGLIGLDSPYHASLATLIQALIGLLSYLQKYLNHPGKNDLATASLELVSALLKLVRHGSARTATNRKIWEALNLDARVICRLLATKRKTPLVTKYGRKPDIRHLMLNVLCILLGPTSGLSMKIDILSQKGVPSAIFKGLSEDPAEVVETVLDSIARLYAIERLPLDLRCRAAEDSWNETLKLYARNEPESEAQGGDHAVYPPAMTAHRYMLFTVNALATTGDTLAPIQRKALGGLIGLLQLSDSSEQADVAAQILSAAPQLLPSFWAKFAPSLEPRLSSKWVASIAFATRVVSSPISSKLLPAQSATKHSGDRSATSVGLLLDSALMPPNLGKAWVSRALQMSGTSPLVAYLTCQFLHAGMQKCLSILQAIQHNANTLSAKEKQTTGAAWQVASSRIAAEAAERLPDLQIMIALVQKSLGRAFSRAGSVASVAGTADGSDIASEQSEEDNTLMTSLTLRTIYAYRELVPSVFSRLRFDFGKVLGSAFFSSAAEIADPLAAVGQAALLRIISLPADVVSGEGAVTWAWSKSSEGTLSPLASIIRIYLSSPVQSLQDVAQSAAQSLLGSSILFEHNPSEVAIWLDSLPRSGTDSLEVLVFLDGCIQRCLQTPYKYVDAVSKLTAGHSSQCANEACHVISPLVATILEQLVYRFSKPASAAPFMVYFRHVLVDLLARSKCRCYFRSVTQALAEEVRHLEQQDVAVRELQLLEHFVALVSNDLPPPSLAVTETTLSQFESYLSLAETGTVSQLCEYATTLLANGSATTTSGLARITGFFMLGYANIGSLLTALLKNSTSSSRALFAYTLLDTPDFAIFLRKHLVRDDPLADTLCAFMELSASHDVTRSLPETVLQALKQKAMTACPTIVKQLPAEDLLSVLGQILTSTESLPNLEKALSAVCAALQTMLDHVDTSNAIAQHWQLLYKSRESGALQLLGYWALCALPPSFAGAVQTTVTPLCAAGRRVALSAISKLALQALQDGIDHEEIDMVVATALYTSPEVYSTFAKLNSLAITGNAARSWLAYVRVSTCTLESAPSKITFAQILPSIAEQIAGKTSTSQLSELIVAIVKSNENLVPPMADHLANLFNGAEMDAHPERLTLSNLSFLMELQSSTKTIDMLAVLEKFITGCLPRIVRSFSGDAAEYKTMTQVIENICTSSTIEETVTITDYFPIATCLQLNSGKWLLKAHLVEPVVTAVVQHRLEDASALRLAACLVKQCKLHPSVYVRLVQQMTADRRFRTGIVPSNELREQLVELVAAFDKASIGIFVQTHTLAPLFAVYQGTMNRSDRQLLGIFRSAELQGHVSLQRLLSTWVPWHMRGLAVGPTQVLANMDAKILYDSMCFVLKSNQLKASMDEIADPAFYMGVTAALLDEEAISRSTWISLISSNALGLAICSLASPHKEYASAGDRILAKARNVLQSSDIRDKSEILFLLDAAKNAVLPNRSTSVPGLPALTALFIADALRALAVPEGWLYPRAWRWLLGQPLVDTNEVPLFYTIFYGTSDDRHAEMQWLLHLLASGVQSGEDWRLLRRRQVVELFISYLQRGEVGNEPGEESRHVLSTLAEITTIPQAVHDLVSRNGFLASIAMQRTTIRSTRDTLQIVLNCVTLVQPSKLRRARDGLWLAEVILYLSELKVQELADDCISMLCTILRYCAAYLACAESDTKAAIEPTLINVLSVATRNLSRRAWSGLDGASADLLDAVIRLNILDGDLFEQVCSLGLRCEIKGLREDLIRIWHAKETATVS